jgi:hypothetical protein
MGMRIIPVTCPSGSIIDEGVSGDGQSRQSADGRNHKAEGRNGDGQHGSDGWEGFHVATDIINPRIRARFRIQVRSLLPYSPHSAVAFATASFKPIPII